LPIFDWPFRYSLTFIEYMLQGDKRDISHILLSVDVS
jgi:hypothetical protein